MMLFATGLLKILIGVVGVIGAIIFAALALFKRTRKGKLQYARLTLLTTFIFILLITGYEFLKYPANSKLDQLVLMAYREAPLGTYWLGVYSDSQQSINSFVCEVLSL